MLEALCRPSSTILDIVHAEDGPPITQRTSGLVQPHSPRMADFDTSLLSATALANDIGRVSYVSVRLSTIGATEGRLSDKSVA